MRYREHLYCVSFSFQYTGDIIKYRTIYKYIISIPSCLTGAYFNRKHFGIHVSIPRKEQFPPFHTNVFDAVISRIICQVTVTFTSGEVHLCFGNRFVSAVNNTTGNPLSRTCAYFTTLGNGIHVCSVAY